MKKAYVGDIGTKIYIDMRTDLSQFTELKAYVKKPKPGGGQEVVVWNFEVNPYNPNQMVHVIQPGELNAKGKYTIRPYGKKSGWEGSGDPVVFEVY
jgi:hypothetical protein